MALVAAIVKCDPVLSSGVAAACSADDAGALDLRDAEETQEVSQEPSDQHEDDTR